jgi:hypothetical protein
MDVLWLDSLRNLRNTYRNDDAVFCLESGYLAVGFLGSKPNCPLFADILNAAKPNQNYQGFGTDLLGQFSGGQGIKAIDRLRDKYPLLRIVNAPQETVYPFDWREIPKLFTNQLPLPPKTLGVHWFGGSQLAQQYNNLLTPDNYNNHPSTITNCIRIILQ